MLLNDVPLIAEEGKTEGEKGWTFMDAADVIRRLQLDLDHLEAGYVLTIGGSVAREGAGRDLDITFLPCWLNAWDGAVVAEYLAERWLVMNYIHFDVSHRYWQVVYEDEQGRIIDCVFWRTVNEDPMVHTLRQAKLEDAIMEDGWGMGV